MSFTYKNNLLIEFRAVPYSTSHVLEYRISPNQDLNYEKEYSIFGIKFKLNKKFSTNWHQPSYFVNHPSAYLYEQNDYRNYIPLFIENKHELAAYQLKYKTIGDFFSYVNEKETKELEKYIIKHNTYLNNKGIWR